ncbi:MAG: hypothetical protein M1829_002351 [Trizodia sp. TS-e1964]|nr:MAG: hypothetical protein M1829_002351 [Trizodia sp. TS-e1964]
MATSIAGANAPSASYLHAPRMTGTVVPSLSYGQANRGTAVSQLTAYTVSAQQTANGTWTRPSPTSNISVPPFRATPSPESMARITTPNGFSLMIVVMAIIVLMYV